MQSLNKKCLSRALRSSMYFQYHYVCSNIGAYKRERGEMDRRDIQSRMLRKRDLYISARDAQRDS